jgi:hypothetical protein
VERNWLSIRRSPCNKRSTCWSVLMCCKKTSWVELHFEKNIYVCIPRFFLVINVCNQGKTLYSPCILIFTALISAEIYWKQGILSDIKVYTSGFSFIITTRPNSAMADCIQ